MQSAAVTSIAEIEFFTDDSLGKRQRWEVCGPLSHDFCFDDLLWISSIPVWA